MLKTQFKNIRIGDSFYFNGELYLKVDINTGANGDNLRYFTPNQRIELK